MSHRQGKAVDWVSPRGGEAEHRRHCARVIQAHEMEGKGRAGALWHWLGDNDDDDGERGVIKG